MIGNIKLIECPRDAMQSFPVFIPTALKAQYINALIKVGFDTIDFGSFVSPKAIPQLSDTAELTCRIDLSGSKTKLLVIIANLRGAVNASQYDEISYLGFPHAISSTFLKLNINSSPDKAKFNIEAIQNLCLKTKKQLVVYLSLAFGNPYSEKWNIDIIFDEIEYLKKLDIKTIILADTLGDGDKDIISTVYNNVLPQYPDIEFGFHLHTDSVSWLDKLDAAYNSGCRRFDSVMLGLGGCPMADKMIVGNLSTENLLAYFKSRNIEIPINIENYNIALNLSKKIFTN